MNPVYCHANLGLCYHNEVMNNLKRKGFTARITFSHDVPIVNVQVAFCSTKDQFTKKIGRRVAAAVGAVEMPVWELSNYLARAEALCTKNRSSIFISRYRGLERRVTRQILESLLPKNEQD